MAEQVTRRSPSATLLNLLAVTAATGALVPAIILSGPLGLFGLIGVITIGSAWLVLRHRRRGLVSAPVGLAAATALVAIVPLASVVLTPTTSRPWIVPLFLSVAAGARLSWVIGDGAQRLVEAIVWIFVYVFFGLAPLVQMRTGIDPVTTPFVDHSLDARALTVVVSGVCALGLGLFVARRRLPPGNHADTAPAVRPERVTALSIVGLLCAGYFVAKGGVGPLRSSRVELDRAANAAWSDSTTVAVVRALSMMPLLVAFVALRIEKARSLSRGWFRTTALPAVTGTVLLLVANPIGNARYTSGTVYLAVLASLGLVATRPRFRAMCAGFVASLVLLFPLADAYRYSTTASFKETDPVAALTTGDFDAFAQVVNTVQYVELHGITYGYQALGPLVFWIPRDVWPAKPIDTGILLANSRGYDFTNLSAPLWTELFINGGWGALLVGMFVFGMLIRRWDSGIMQALERAPTPGLLACILPFYLLILLRGSLLQATAALALLAGSGWFVRERRPRLSWPFSGNRPRAADSPQVGVRSVRPGMPMHGDRSTL